MNNFSFPLSKRATTATSSAIREILKVTERPDIISFAGGLPSPEGFPVEQLHQAYDKVLSTQPKVALQYGPTEGYRPLREWVVSDFKSRGVDICVDNVLVVSGSQQALDLIGKLFIDEGSKVLLESPSYLGAIQSFSQFGPQYATIPTDDDGLIPEGLTDELAKDARFAYVLPNYQNPTGRTLSLERRIALVKRAAELNLPLVEDDPYGELRFEGEALPGLFALAQQHGATVIRMGSFSKVLSPGLRIGFIIAPEAVIRKLVQLKQATDLHTATVTQMAVYEAVKDGFLAEHLPKVRELYKRQCHYMLEALEQNFAGVNVTWTRPKGGMFIWMTFDGDVNTTELLARAVEEQKVAYVPGQPFYPYAQTAPTNHLRLSFVTVPEEKIRIGIANLSKLFK
ncbi:PLP-dependent aminotransferase family protein [Pelistega europaea]|uniref:PLP-dependent aminotransferase family protein n=1 Tax=Pelistega europaea TaxID=106147 RepID=A0A7Y4L9G9_9BURK|nr:PLP-dependent aminotransferase family protein [Pelistega europaea]NOL49430.1 PLP-dependent aminotransferase family protein [Pelistega europaea]